LPVVGGLIAWAVRGRARLVVGFCVALAVLGGVVAAVVYRSGLAVSHSWMPQVGAYYALRLDGLSAWLSCTSAFIVAVVCLVQLSKYQHSSPTFVPLVLILEGLTLFTFMADDALLFFFFFEATLVPMYFLISGGGGARQAGVALKFLLYSLAGGLVLLGGIVYLMVASPSLRYEDLAQSQLPEIAQQVLCLIFFVSFAVKAPLVPLHPWLPDAIQHGQPMSSVLLVGLLDGIGLYGMMRFCIGVTPQGASWAAFGIEIVALVTIVYGALAAAVSRNLLRLAGFASISHAGFMVLGLFAFTSSAMTGVMTYIGAHALSASALLLAITWVVARRGDSLQPGAFGGLARRAPVLAGVFLMAGLATLALPGTANFAAEFAVIIGTWARHPVLAAVSLAGVLAAGVYVLWSYQVVFTGTPSEDQAARSHDIGRLARLGAGLLLAAILLVGVYPVPVQQLVDANTQLAMTQAQTSDPEPGGH